MVGRSLCIVAVLGAIFEGNSRAEPALQIASPETSLIVADKGAKLLHFHLVEVSMANSGRLVVELHHSGLGGPADNKAAAIAETPVSGAAADSDVTIAVPDLGFYELRARIEDGDKKVIASLTTSFAAVPVRTDVGPPDFGVCTHFAQRPPHVAEEMALVKLAGFSRIRDESPWQGMERTPGTFVSLPQADEYIDLASRLGLVPLIILDYGNAVAYPDLFGHGSIFPDTPDKRDLFTAYAAEMVKLYGAKVKDWELWNEPQGWGKVGPDVYTSLLKQVYTKIKEIDPHANVISCGGGGAGGGPGGDYITGIIHNGGLEYQDGFSIHSYMSPYTPELGYEAHNGPIPAVSIPIVWPHLAQFIDSHPKTDGKKLQLWVTEFGWFSSPYNYFDGDTIQAAYVARSFLLSRRYGTVAALFLYDFADDGTNSQNKEHNFGLIHRDFSPKPGYVSMAVMSATLGDRPWANSLIDDNDAKVFQYQKDDDSIIAGWTVNRLGMGVTLKLPPGTYIKRNWDGREEEVVITDKGYDWTLRILPQYLFLKKS